MPTARSAIFGSFVKLGLTAFGGPVAHLGYFHEEFVVRRRWLDDREYADLVALCQFLPGPASSQVAFAIGLKMGGKPGAFLAWLAFTLPSALLMIGLALGLAAQGEFQVAGWMSGLKLAAVAVVAEAIWSMGTRLCPDLPRALIAAASAALLLALNEAVWQVLAIVLGGALGWGLFRRQFPQQSLQQEPARPGASKVAWPYLVAFAALLVGLPVLKNLTSNEAAAVFDGFYRAGSLVFGGGHVILPLLEQITVRPGWVDRETFLAGYGAAQALPGPLFTFAGFLGAKMSFGPGGILGGLLALLAINLPSWLLLLGAIPSWNRLRHHQSAQAALRGTNAAVVGLLLAAFCHPIWTTSITGPQQLAFAVAGFCLLRFAKIPPWLLVALCAAVGQWVFS